MCLVSQQLLGIVIDMHLKGFSHINFFKLKHINYYHNSAKLTTKFWGFNNKVSQIWYQIITETIISYGVGIWEGN